MGRKAKRTATKDKRTGDSIARPPSPRTPVAAYGRGEAALFALTLFLSAALLFTVEPMFAKMVLPRLGGAPAVWIACLVFYQAALLGGYLYAHLTLQWLGPRRQALLHLGLLGLAWISLPIHIAAGWLPPATTFPAPWLWSLLAFSLGLPFLAVSASAPMLQAWFAKTRTVAGRDPYFLYAASNLGSLLALLAYPLLIEAHLTLARQSLCWAILYGLLIALIAACAVILWRARGAASVGRPSQAVANRDGLGSPSYNREVISDQVLSGISARRRLRWLALSLVPSSLLMGVTTYITSEVTQMPFLWIIPLALYLLTFVLVFAPRTLLPQKWMVRVQSVLIVAATLSLLFNVAGLREMLLLGLLHLAAFFVTAMVCHGQLAADRPEPERLTEFYLWLSLGGVLGGLFSALLAPLLFNRPLEYPLMMVAACMLRPPVAAGQQRRHEAIPIAALILCLILAWGLRSVGFLSGLPFTDTPTMRTAVVGLAAFDAFLLRRRPAVFGIAVAALAAISLWSVETGTETMEISRSFFGILRVERDSVWNTHQLTHGTTIHGQQSFDESHRREPQGYYHRSGPLGRIFETLRPRRPLAEVGILGLGVGTIAAYAEPGERFTFYEIDPAVERIAWNPAYFTYLADCRGEVKVVLGDARLSLEHELLEHESRKFDLLVADVFSSDIVPVHLMTREALQVYFDRLKPNGLLAFHISSRYLDLEPILGRLAVTDGRAARIWRDLELNGPVGRTVSVWVVMARRGEDLGPLADDPLWKPLVCDAGPVWTDDFSNILAAMKREPPGLHLVPWKWHKSNKALDHAARAQALLAENRIDEAIEHFLASVKLNPDDEPNQYGLARALAARGRTEEAVEHYEEALALAPNHAAAHGDLGVALEKLGKIDEAILKFRAAVALDPSSVVAFNNLGNALLGHKEYDEALASYRQALTLAQQQHNAPLVKKIQAEIERCAARPRDDGKK